MKQPSLEEVKEYFKNAKTVQCICMCDGGSVDITENIETDIHEFNGGYWIDLESEHYIPKGVKLWGNGHWAKILTYKEKTFSITESQIKEVNEFFLIHNSKESSSKLKEWFPEVFESKIIPDTFWFHNTGELCLIFEVTKNNGGTVKCKHISNDSDNFAYHGIGCMDREAKEEEIREFLKKESIKRGFVPGCYTVINGLPKEIRKFSGKNPARYGYYAPEKKFLLNNGSIFKNGKWAEIIPTITLSEAEQQLGKKIIV